LTKPGLLLFRGKGSAREKIEGDFFNLIGLLLFRLGKIMERFGIPVFEGRFSWFFFLTLESSGAVLHEGYWELQKQ